jgi:hypothetical protein
MFYKFRFWGFGGLHPGSPPLGAPLLYCAQSAFYVSYLVVQFSRFPLLSCAFADLQGCISSDLCH